MPIKPGNKKLYPDNWKELIADIRERSNDQCELCGASNHLRIQRHVIFPALWVYDSEDDPEDDPLRYDYSPAVKVILTVAHINQDPTDNRMCNLLHLCQRCHNRIDLPYRMLNAAKTREKKKE